jgi:glycerol-3-phosphate dehydrogenase
MATRSRFARPLIYIAGATAFTGGVIYISYRPLTLPGSEPAAVPPPVITGGAFQPPRFPRVKTREEQIADLKSTSKVLKSLESKSFLGGLFGSSATPEASEDDIESEPYDLLIIGGGATGAGIALDAVTRGLKVAVVERDDFASGTSSKSTKLVHGGVRYLEKAVWELDYNQ